MTQETASNPSGNKLRFSIDLRIVTVMLLIIIAAMLFIWRPWSGDTNANAHTIEVQ